MHSLAMGKGFISHLKIKNLSTLLQPRAANILGAASGMSFPFQLPQAAKPMATEHNKEILEQGVQINTCAGPECFSVKTQRPRNAKFLRTNQMPRTIDVWE